MEKEDTTLSDLLNKNFFLFQILSSHEKNIRDIVIDNINNEQMKAIDEVIKAFLSSKKILLPKNTVKKIIPITKYLELFIKDIDLKTKKKILKQKGQKIFSIITQDKVYQN